MLEYRLETEFDIGLITVVEAGRTLALATRELRYRPNREHLEEFQQAHWNLNRFAMGLSPRDVAVDDCPRKWTDGEIRKFMRSDFGLFLPEVASTSEGLSLLSKVYPAMMWDEQNVPALVSNVDKTDNVINLFGWLKPEKSIDAPFAGTDETKARAAIAGKHRLAQTLNVYGEAGQESKLLTGHFLDEVRTWVRILSSRSGGRVVEARFHRSGSCNVYWDLQPGYGGFELLGARSVGV